MIDFGDDKKVPHDRGTYLTFPEIVGQDELKRALLAVAANDGLDGLLAQGEKGTAKSTTVRALTDLLPDQTVVEDCPFGCSPDAPEAQCADCRQRADPPTATRPVPLVTLPLGATRERVVGTLSVADALDGEHEFDPGLLARANRGILYVDEVNLLDDHLVDVLLDAAVSGVNRVERDGVSITHPTDFTLVGTMNPEEGDLRPQLRDRFALQATVTGCADLDQRVEIIDRALGDDSVDTVGRSATRSDDAPPESESAAELRQRLVNARDRLDDVDLPEQFKTQIAELCRDAGLDGHRGDIATARAARTFAALDGRAKVIEGDVRRAAALALPHRLRSRPFEDAPDPDDLIEDQFGDEDGHSGDGEQAESPEGNDDPEGEQPESEDYGSEDGHDETDNGPDDDPSSNDGDAPDGERSDRKDAPQSSGNQDGGDAQGRGTASTEQRGDEASAERRDETKGEDDNGDTEAGSETAEGTEATPIVPGQSRAEIGQGRAPDVTPPESIEDETGGDSGRTQTQASPAGNGARVRTERATARNSIDAAASIRAAGARGASSVDSRDLRHSVRQQDAGALVVFAVDASASMLPAMRSAKGTVLELLKDAYQQRDEVAFVAFAGDDAEVLLPPTSSVTLAARHLKELPTGDRTPLPAGLRSARDVLERADPAAGIVVLVTDGRANVPDGSPVEDTRAAARAVAETGAHVIVVDASEEGGDDDRRLVGTIVSITSGDRIPLSALSPERVDAAVGRVRK